VTDRNWEAELAKIDKQIQSLPEDRMVPAKVPVPAPGPVGGAPRQPVGVGSAEPATVRTTTLGVTIRLLLATSLAVGILFWPYEARCGLGLAGYLAAVVAVAVGGAWSAVWSWRHRAARAHVLSLLLILWGLILASTEVLPRTGLVTRTGAPPVAWVCR
jgi:hypothetical protein